MNIIIDIILCAIVALGVYIGFRCGLLKIAAKPVKFFAVLAFAIGFAKRFAKTVVAPFIGPSVTGYVSSFLRDNSAEITAENVSEKLPTVLKISAAVFNIDVNEIASTATDSVVERIIEKLTAPLISLVAVVISFLLLYVLGKLLFALLVSLLNGIASHGVLGILNKTLGVVFSTALFILIAWGVAVVMELVFSMPAFSENPAISGFEGGIVYKFFNTYNPIELILSF